jgi:hypothetical protein
MKERWKEKIKVGMASSIPSTALFMMGNGNQTIHTVTAKKSFEILFFSLLPCMTVYLCSLSLQAISMRATMRMGYVTVGGSTSGPVGISTRAAGRVA